MTKKRKLERREQIDVYELFDNQSLDDVVLKVHSLARKYEAEVLTYDKEVKTETEHYGYDGGMEVYAAIYRWETDEEYDKRLSQEAAAKERARKAKETKKAKALAQALTTEQEERELLAKLQEKYGV